MALYTVGTPVIGTNKTAFRVLENVVITNQTTDSVAVSNAVPVPDWAGSCSFYIYMTSMTGTTPLLDFTFLYGQYTTNPPTVMATPAKMGNAGLTITQITAAAQVNLMTVDIGPSVTTDTTGSGTASSYYALNTYLPPYIIYTYTTDGTTDDEDYAFDICVYFRA